MARVSKQAQIDKLQLQLADMEILLNQANQRRSIVNDSEEHLRARTELIKAMSYAMRTCSSIMWSEKATGWDFAKLNRR